MVLTFDPANVAPQDDSPLFKLLPPEVRKVIWLHAVLPCDDPTSPYPTNTHYCRPPDYTHYQLTSLSILLTCRRIYAEASDIREARDHEYVIYADRTRGPPPRADLLHEPQAEIFPHAHIPGMRRIRIMNGRLQPGALSAVLPKLPAPHLVKRVHLFVQQYWLEGWRHDSNGLYPLIQDIEHLTVTIRRSDWWFWESDEPLGMDPRIQGRFHAADMHRMWRREDDEGVQIEHSMMGWGFFIALFTNLKTFILNLETAKDKENELKPIVERALRWKFVMQARPGADTRHIYGLAANSDRDPIRWREWQGPPVLNTDANAEEPEGPPLIAARIVYRHCQLLP